MNKDIISIILIISTFIIFVVVLAFVFPIHYFFLAKLSGVNISMKEFFMLKFKKLSISRVIKALILSEKAGLNIHLDMVEATLLAGGNIENVILGLTAAKSAGIDMDYKEATQLDLQGRNILEEVRKRL